MQQQKTLINDFTQGNIPRQMLRFAVPFMISNALQVLYSIVDMIVVGNVVGSAGLAAVSTASQVFTFMTMLCLGFATGGQVYISQLIGSGQRERLDAAIGTLFFVVVLIGVGMTGLGLVSKSAVLKLLNTPPESYDMAVSYMLVCSCGILFTYGYNMVSAVLRGMGDSRHPFLFIAIAAVMNLFLDILFVAYFHWGVAGAALATILGQAFSFFYAVIFLYRKREAFGFSFRLTSLIPDRTILRALAKLGIPFALQSCAINLSMLFVNSLVNALGVSASAVFGVGIKVDDIVNKITLALSYATSAMVGQNIAAGNPRRVRAVVHYSWLFSGLAYALFTVLYLSFSRQLFGIFTEDTSVIQLAPVFVSALVWSFPAMALMRGTGGLLQGIGHARLGLYLALLDGFVMRIACSYLFGITFGLGLFGFFLGYGLAAYGTSVPGMLYFFFGKWEERALVTQ